MPYSKKASLKYIIYILFVVALFSFEEYRVYESNENEKKSQKEAKFLRDTLTLYRSPLKFDCVKCGQENNINLLQYNDSAKNDSVHNINKK